jgi:hypothetical protein
MEPRIAPSHSAVAAAVEARAPEVADWIRRCETEVRPAADGRLGVDRCWGDLLFELQRMFPAAVAADAVAAIADAGYGWCVREMFAPATPELRELFDRVARMAEPYREAEVRARRLKAVTIAGSIVYFREQWRRARVAWMASRGVAASCGEREFCDAVVAWLLEGSPVDEGPARV